MPKPDRFAELRRSYMNGEGSLAQLSERFGVPKRTLERRCANEGWRRAIDECGGRVAAVAADVAAEEGRKLGLDAAGLVARTVAITERFIDQIEAKLASGELTVSELRNLTSSWKDTVSVGREAFGLDAQTSNQQVLHVHLMSEAKFVRIADSGEAPPMLEAQSG